MGEVQVSVIIPARDAADTIGEQLAALREQRFDGTWEVLVVDNGSRDETPAIVESAASGFPQLRLIHATDGSGPGYARNVGAQHARGDSLLYCDADDVVTPGWVEALTDGLAASEAVGGHLDEVTLNSAESRLLRYPMTSDHLHEVVGFPRAPASNLGVRAEVFDRLGGFDESYGASQDAEFSIRLQVAGYRLTYVPSAVVHYRHADDVRTNLRKLYRWSAARARLYAQYRDQGATREPLRGLARWAWLAVCSFFLLAGRKRRLRWLSRAARNAGRLSGSIRYRTLYL